MAGIVYYEEIVRAVFFQDFLDVRVFKKEETLRRATRNRIVGFLQATQEAAARGRSPWQKSRVGHANIESATRVAESVAIDDQGLVDQIRRDIARNIFGDERLAAATCPGNDANLQIQRYGLNSYFELHHDSVDEDQMAAPPTESSRLLSVFLYINGSADFTGGETVFPRAGAGETGRTVVPETFQAAAWPNYMRRADGEFRPDPRAEHQAMPLKQLRTGKQYKYGMNIWFCLKPGVFELARPVAPPRVIIDISSDDDEVIVISESPRVRALLALALASARDKPRFRALAAAALTAELASSHKRPPSL